jgi:hypothetical protein
MPIPPSMLAAFTQSSVPHTGQRSEYSMGGGPKGASRSALSCGTPASRRIASPTHHLELVIDATGRRMPPLPHVPLMVAMRTEQRIVPRPVTVAFPTALGRPDRDGTCDDAPSFRQGRLKQPFDCGKRLGRLHPVGAYPLAPFGQPRLPHPTDKGRDLHAFSRHPLRLVGALRVGGARTSLPVQPSQGARWTHHRLRSIHRPTLRARRHLTLLHIGDKAVGLLSVASLPQPSHRVSVQGLAPPLQDRPLPLLGQHRLGPITYLPPLVCRLIPATPGRHAVPMRLVLAMTPMSRAHDDRAPLRALPLTVRKKSSKHCTPHGLHGLSHAAACG